MQTLIIYSAPADPSLDKIKGHLQVISRKTEMVLASEETALRGSLQSRPDLIVVSLHGQSSRPEELLHRIRSVTEARVLVIGPISDPKFILRTLQTGADLYIDRDEIETEIPPALGRLFPRLESGAARGRLLGVMSASGGCGASTLAVNIAAVFARMRGSCGLIDLNPGRGDLPALLDLKPQFTLTDVCTNEARIDRAMLEKMLIRHPSGIQLLAAPAELAEFRSLTSTGVHQALSLSATIFRETVVDLEDCIHGEQIEALELLDEMYLVCRLDFTSLRHTRRLIEHLNGLGIQRARVRLVVNLQGQPNELQVEEAEQAIGEALSWFLPYDPKSINASNNLGLPVVLKFPNAKISQSITQMVTPGTSRASRKQGLLEKIKLMLGSNAEVAPL